MTEDNYWRQRYEMLMATFSEAVKAAIDAHAAPRYLADADSYNLGKLRGAQEEREACVQLCEAEFWHATRRHGSTAGAVAGNCAAAIRARKDNT